MTWNPLLSYLGQSLKETIIYIHYLHSIEVTLVAAKTWNRYLSPKLAALVPVDLTNAFHSFNSVILYYTAV